MSAIRSVRKWAGLAACLWLVSCGQPFGRSSHIADASTVTDAPGLSDPGADTAGSADATGTGDIADTADAAVPGDAADGADAPNLYGQVKLSQAEDIFINASSANPPTHCFQIYNSGNAPLIFQKASFATANPQYTITKMPNAGEQIAGTGSPDNPVGQASLELCVRYLPNVTAGDEDVTLEIFTNDPQSPTSTIKISAQSQTGTYTVSCDDNDPTGFDFKGANLGTTRNCTVAVGQLPLLITSLEVVAEDPDQDAAAKAAYSCVVESPKGLASVHIACKFKADGSNAPPAAHLAVSYAQANNPGNLALPLIAGTCEQPALALAPDASQQLWFLATVGKSAVHTAIVANQSCAPLQLVQACVTSANISSENACDNLALASTDYSVSLVTGGKPAPFSLVSVPPWGLQALQIEFKPLTLKQNNLALLHVRYCAGKWEDAAKQCVGGQLVTQKLTLAGSQDATLKQPLLTLNSPFGVKVGKPVALTGKVTNNAWDAKNFLWLVSERPANSAVWLYGMTTEQPAVTFVPDEAGHYTLVGLAQTYDDSDPSKMAWSAQATVGFDVK